jgi:hypothetical protein
VTYGVCNRIDGDEDLVTTVASVAHAGAEGSALRRDPTSNPPVHDRTPPAENCHAVLLLTLGDRNLPQTDSEVREEAFDSRVLDAYHMTTKGPILHSHSHEARDRLYLFALALDGRSVGGGHTGLRRAGSGTRAPLDTMGTKSSSAGRLAPIDTRTVIGEAASTRDDGRVGSRMPATA